MGEKDRTLQLNVIQAFFGALIGSAIAVCKLWSQPADIILEFLGTLTLLALITGYSMDSRKPVGHRVWPALTSTAVAVAFMFYFTTPPRMVFAHLQEPKGAPSNGAMYFSALLFTWIVVQFAKIIADYIDDMILKHRAGQPPNH